MMSQEHFTETGKNASRLRYFRRYFTGSEQLTSHLLEMRFGEIQFSITHKITNNESICVFTLRFSFRLSVRLHHQHSRSVLFALFNQITSAGLAKDIPESLGRDRDG